MRQRGGQHARPRCILAETVSINIGCALDGNFVHTIILVDETIFIGHAGYVSRTKIFLASCGNGRFGILQF
jgi:hypothetical protein